MHNQYFSQIMDQLSEAFENLCSKQFERLLQDCEQTMRANGKIVVSGLGKNVPICEKFVGTMNSLGLNGAFLHTNTAMHGDLGLIGKEDLVIILSKSGSTIESSLLFDYLKDWQINMWLISFNEGGELGSLIENKLLIPLQHEGDSWNIIPNNSSSCYLILLQGLALQLAERMGVQLHHFKRNHPGGAIGQKLSKET